MGFAILGHRTMTGLAASVMLGVSVYGAGAVDPSAGEFTFRIYPVPEVETLPCQDRADALRERLLTLGEGISSATAICRVDEYLHHSEIVVAYTRESGPLEHVENMTGGAFSVPRGLFESEAACQEQVMQEVATFEAATGLTAISSFCFREAYVTHKPWGVRLDALGTPRLRPMTTSVIASLPRDSEAIKRDLAHLMAVHGGTVVHFVSRPTLPFSTLAIHYYGTRWVRLEGLELRAYPIRDRCMSEEQRLRPRLGDSPSVFGASYCSGAESGVSSLWILAAGGGLVIDKALESYSTLDLCETARPAIEERSQRALGDQFVGTTCVSEMSRVRVNVLRWARPASGY